MTTLRKPRATKAKMEQRRNAWAGGKPGTGMLLPGLVKERHHMYQERLKKLQARTDLDKPTRVCAASTVGTYDGADLKPYEGRPGAMDAYSLPSRGIGA